MKLSINVGTFLNALDKAARFVNGRNTDRPVTSNIYLAAGGDGLEICSTNLAVAYRTVLGCSVQEEGRITVPAVLLKNLVAQLEPSSSVTLASTETMGVTIKNAAVDVEIRGIDAEDFPYGMFAASTANPTWLGVSPALFATAIGQVIAFVSSDNSQTINGVLLKLDGSRIVFAATDTYRLVLRELTTEADLATLRLLIPGDSLRQMQSIADKSVAADTGINLSANNGQVVFHMGNEDFVCPIMSDTAAYPDLERFFSPLLDSATQIDIASDEALRHARIAGLFVDETRIPSVILWPKSEGLVLESAAPVGKSQTTARCSIHGEEAIALNVKYLAEAIEGARSKSVVLQIIDRTEPLLVVGTGYRAMIMPFELTN